MRRLLTSLNLNHLNNEARVSIENICAKFSDVFHLSNDKLTTANLYDQTIQLKPNVDPVPTIPTNRP